MEAELAPSKPNSDMDETLKTILRRMKAEGVTRSKFLRMTDLAKRVGLLSQYENMNKVCSKFVDPTSWNLFTGDDGPTRFPYASELFFLYGAKYLAIVFAEVRPHILKYGLRHKA
jgi:hypothetical protein